MKNYNSWGNSELIAKISELENQIIKLKKQVKNLSKKDTKCPACKTGTLGEPFEDGNRWCNSCDCSVDSDGGYIC